MPPLACLQGRLLPVSEAHLAPNDAGFVWGATVTDLCRTFQHRLFRWAEHLQRFRRSGEGACIPLAYSDAELTHLAEQLISHNKDLLAPGQDLALVLFATPGPIGHYLDQEGLSGPPTVGMHTFAIPLKRHARLLREGARLTVPSIRALPATTVDPHIKHRSRLYWWLAEQEAQRLDPGSSALLLDERGFVTETAAANLLLVRQGEVVSPRRTGILEGISLQVVEEGCRALGIPFAEADLTLADCQQADEAMLSNTTFCLAPVSQIHGHALRCPGPLYRALLDWWSQLVGVDIARQILAASGK